MTSGEKAVWAAVFSEAYIKEIRNPPRGITRPRNDLAHEMWEIDQAVSACEMAAGAVERMTECETRVVEGFGEESGVVRYLREMLK